MTHDMNLNDSPFRYIKSGKKDIEMRLYDDRRKALKIGDYIHFINTSNQEQMDVEIINLYVFPSFKEIYDNFDHSRLGYDSSDEGVYTDMEQYYRPNLIDEFGAIAIEIKLV